MKIAVNTRLLLKNRLEGIGWFTYETLKRITCQHPEHEFIFLFDRKWDEEFIFSNNITPLVIQPQARHPFLFYFWFEYAVPKALKKTKADLFLSPDGYLSLSTKIKSIAVIHDLNFEHYPQDLPFWARHYYRYYFPKFAQKAVRIATVSEYSKNDIIQQYMVPADKIDVVYNGANEIFKPISEEEKNATRKKYTDGASYFVFVGALHPRKNIARLFMAFDSFKKKYLSTIKLVIVGEKKWWTDEIHFAYNTMQYKADTIFTGRLYGKELRNVMATSLAMSYIPYFEGFGIPIIEAMQCDVPVITSSLTSMPEVSGDAALLVNPFSVDAISEAMLKIAKDEKLRKELIAKGQQRRLNFSWDKTAEKLWTSITTVIVPQ